MYCAAPALLNYIVMKTLIMIFGLQLVCALCAAIARLIVLVISDIQLRFVNCCQNKEAGGGCPFASCCPLKPIYFQINLRIKMLRPGLRKLFSVLAFTP